MRATLADSAPTRYAGRLVWLELDFHRPVNQPALVFWGLGLFPFGALVMRSGFLPKVFDICLILGGAAYLVTSFVALALPQYRQVVAQAMLPFYAIGELPIWLWFLIRGVRAPALEPAA